MRRHSKLLIFTACLSVTVSMTSPAAVAASEATPSEKAASLDVGAQEFDAGLKAYRERKFVEAAQWFEKAAAHGSADAWANLGVMYYSGEGVARDHTKAFNWLTKAAAKGHPEGMFNLGMLYLKGEGVAADVDQARTWLQKASDNGIAQAKAPLEKLNELAAENAKTAGGPESSKALTAYENDRYDEAIAWWEKAAAKGNTEAMRNLGSLYSTNTGVAPDGAKAIAWYEKAARKNEPYAMMDLAALYEEGTVVPQNLPLARHWLEKASAAGGEGAAEKLKGLNSKSATKP
jgi:TPR repeat protein